MTQRWYYARDGQRQGPVPRERLVDLVRDGWLSADDLVWSEGMPEWRPARSFDWLCRGPIARTVQDLVKATLHPGARPDPPVAHPLNIPDQPRQRSDLVDWDRLEASHLLAAAGAFLATLGIAFTVIARTRFALAVTLVGLVLLGLGRRRESAWLLRQAWGNLVQSWREIASHRAEARRLEAERKRTAAELAAAAEPPPPSGETVAPAATAAFPPPLPAAPPPAYSAATRRIVYEPPVRRWRPGLAGLMSLFLPGLGQLYKGQWLNAVAWFLVVAAGYAALVIPGILLHVCCILGACSGDPWTKGRTVYVDDGIPARGQRI